METRFQKLERLSNQKLTLKQLTQLRDEITLEPLDTQPSTPNQLPQKRKLGVTTLLTAAQKRLVDAKARLIRANEEMNADKVNEVKRAQSALDYFYKLASEKLDNVYGDVQSCPFQNNTDLESGYSQFWFAIQCFQSEETYLLLLHRFLIFKRVSTETLCKEKLDKVTVELLSQEFCHPFEDIDESTFFSALRIENTAAMKVMLDLFPELAFRINNRYFPPAHFAAMQGSIEALKLLQKANPETITQVLHASKVTTLMMANNYMRFNAMAWLLEQAPDLCDKTNQYGETALHQAVEVGYAWAVRLLLQHKANFTVLTYANARHPQMTALDIAVNLKRKSDAHKESHQVFMETFEDGYSLFHRSILEDQPFISKLFCKCGVDFTVKTTSKDAYGDMTALQLAYAKRKNEALFTLLEFCYEAAERTAADEEKALLANKSWHDKSQDERQLILIKIKFRKLDELLALDTCPIVNVEPPVNFAEPDTDHLGQIAEPLRWLFDILAYARLRNNGKKHTNKPAEDGVKKTVSESLKFADRKVGEWVGVKVSELSVIANIRDMASYSELEKLSACWEVFRNILMKHADPLDTFDEYRIKIFCDERLGKAAKPMVDHHRTTKQRAEAAHSNLESSSSDRRMLH